MLHAALPAEGQQPLHGVDVVLLVQVVDGGRALHPLVHPRGEDEALTAGEVRFELLVAHFEIVAEFQLHLGGQHRPGGQGRQGQGGNLVASGDQFLGSFGAQEARPADHENLHSSLLI